MLTHIHQSPNLVTFFESLGPPLTEPQKRHLINLADGILVTEGKKTLANIQRQFVEAPDPSNMADFLRISPWDTDKMRRRMQRFLIKRAVEIAEARGDLKRILVTIEDSMRRRINRPLTWRLWIGTSTTWKGPRSGHATRRG